MRLQGLAPPSSHGHPGQCDQRLVRAVFLSILHCLPDCHDYGVLGAPKMGDVAAWASRLEQGIETVYANAINGIRAMPARGTCMDCSDDEIKASIDYIFENSQ